MSNPRGTNQKPSTNHRRTNSNSNNSYNMAESSNITTNANNGFSNSVLQQNTIQDTNQLFTMQSDMSRMSQSTTTNQNGAKDFNKLAQKVDCAGKVPTARFGHIMVMISPTKAVLFGGAVGDTRNFTITNETFCYNVMTKIWTKLNITQNVPCARAAHAACSNDTLQLIVYGGSVGGGALAGDDLFLLDLKNGEEVASWNLIKVSGKTPGKRYGHTLAYLQNFAVVFGGNTGTQPSNDVWIINLEEINLKNVYQWLKIEVKDGNQPSPRVYHACSFCNKGNAKGMMLIFGGRDSAENALNDTWGLRRHRDGNWDWAMAPSYKPDQTPKIRYNHYMLFIGTLMIITGGRSKNIQEVLPTDVYDTETSEWKTFPGVGLFRHMAFNKDNFLYIYGGFENANPNIPVEKIIKVDLTQYFISSTVIQGKLEAFLEQKKEKERKQQESVSGNVPSTSSSTKNNTLIENNPKQDKKFRLSNQAVVLKFNDNLNEDMGIIRKISIDKLNDEGKRIGYQNIRPTMQNRRVYDDNLISKFIDNLLRPFDWFTPEVDEIHNKLPFTLDEIDKLLNETMKTVVNDNTLMRIKSPCKIFGNIFGQYNDLMRIFESFGQPSDDNQMGDVHLFHYVFLGDYVDRGFYSLEVILLLFALKVRYPENINMVRGHHEDSSINIKEGLGDECEKRLGDNIKSENSIFNKINYIFENLPLGVVIDNKILCVHGGIGATIQKLSDINSIKRPIRVVQDVRTIEQQMLIDLLWSEYSEDVSEIAVNEERDITKAGFILKYGKDRLAKFLQENQLMLLITSHQLVQEGMKSFANDKLLVVYSATNYLDKEGNLAGIITLNKNSTHITPKLIDVNVSKNKKANYRSTKNPSPSRK